MAFIYSDYMLEPTQVQEEVMEIGAKISDGDGMFVVLKDYEGEPVIMNIVSMIKISATT